MSRVLHTYIPRQFVENDMSTNTNEKPKKDGMVHASFRKVVAFDVLFFGLGILAGIGIGVYLIAN